MATAPSQKTRQSTRTPTPKAPRKIVERPSVLVCYMKHGDAYFNVGSDEELFTTALAILRGRERCGTYAGMDGTPGSGLCVSEAIKEGNGRDAWRILCKFSEHEYERVEIVPFTTTEAALEMFW